MGVGERCCRILGLGSESLEIWLTIGMQARVYQFVCERNVFGIVVFTARDAVRRTITDHPVEFTHDPELTMIGNVRLECNRHQPQKHSSMN